MRSCELLLALRCNGAFANLLVHRPAFVIQMFITLAVCIVAVFFTVFKLGTWLAKKPAIKYTVGLPIIPDNTEVTEEPSIRVCLKLWLEIGLARMIVRS
jgi:hypothetical protein